jgi:hypothetical protein
VWRGKKSGWTRTRARLTKRPGRRKWQVVFYYFSCRGQWPGPWRKFAPMGERQKKLGTRAAGAFGAIFHPFVRFLSACGTVAKNPPIARARLSIARFGAIIVVVLLFVVDIELKKNSFGSLAPPASCYYCAKGDSRSVLRPRHISILCKHMEFSRLRALLMLFDKRMQIWRCCFDHYNTYIVCCRLEYNSHTRAHTFRNKFQLICARTHT